MAAPAPLPDPVVADLERLAAMDRPSAGPGEAAAARELAGMLEARGLAPVLEETPALGAYWRSLGLAAGLGLAGGVLAGRGRRAAGAALAAAAAALTADDVDNGAHLLRRVLPHGTATNVLAWAGDPAADRTLLLVAHHDSARTGVVFHPGLAPLVDRVAHDWYARQTTSTQTGALMVAGPALVALGAALGVRPVRQAGMVLTAGVAAAMADIERSPVVPGANDNLSAVAVLLALAGRLQAEPVAGLRVGLLSTGSEEGFMEGMRGFMARHAGELDPAATTVLALECVGSPHLALLEGEGMLVMREYDERAKALVQAAADDAGIALWRGLRLGAGGTDALPALRRGYRTACLAGVTDLKTPANYHWPTDTPERLDHGTIAEAVEVCWATIARLAA